MTAGPDRRQVIGGAAAGLALLVSGTGQAAGVAMIQGQGPREITHDPDQPVLGNPNGDVTVVEYFDYQCPYCRAFHPSLLDYVRRDGNLRLVMKDFPIFGAASEHAVRLSLGAAGLGKYEAVHLALMANSGGRIAEKRLDAACRKAGVDPTKALARFEEEAAKWSALVNRNIDEADYFGLPGTPAYLVGLNLFPRVIDLAELQAAVAAARQV